MSRFRVRALVCATGPSVIEVRGIVGGPALVAAVDDTRALLMLPSERIAYRGAPEDASFWQDAIGIPVSGQLLATLTGAELSRPIVVAGDRAALGRPPENVLEIL